MDAATISALDPGALDRRLRALAGDERRVQVDFLLHLAEFDRRRAFLDAGYPSLWEWCQKELHLREGAAGRRIGAMRILRRFPSLEAPLRDGRLCLSTASLLGTVLTPENLDDLVARAAFCTKAEVDRIVVSIQPRTAPRDGVRKLPERHAPAEAAAPTSSPSTPAPMSERCCTAAGAIEPPAPSLFLDDDAADGSAASTAAREPRKAMLRPVATDRYSLNVTIDASWREDLDTLSALLSHKIPNGDLAEVLHEALRCAIEKHGKRRGAVKPARARHRTEKSTPERWRDRYVPAEVRRQVWERDGGRCTYVGEDGRRCDSRWQLELDHIESPSSGGTNDASNLRLRCRSHNIWYAEQVYGRAHMAQFRKTGSPRLSEIAIASDSESAGRSRRPAVTSPDPPPAPDSG